MTGCDHDWRPVPTAPGYRPTLERCRRCHRARLIEASPAVLPFPIRVVEETTRATEAAERPTTTPPEDATAGESGL